MRNAPRSGRQSSGPLDTIADQLAGAQVAAANLARAAAEDAALGRQNTALSEALAEMQVVRLFVNDTPHILGTDATKHGEVAEAVEVGIRRAKDALEQRDFTAHDELSRTSKVDYWVKEDAVQSKFINGTNKGLSHVLEHIEKYKEFGRDGKSYYHIPKDQYEQILQARSGNGGELSEKTVRAIQAKLDAIEVETGKPWDEVVRPSTSNYAEVQKGNVNETIDRHEDDLEKKNEDLKDNIQADHEPSLYEGLRTAAMAGAVAGAFGFAASAGKKYFGDGKNIFRGDFTAQDWKDVGLDIGKSALAGAVTGGAVYALTNYVGASAPLASAFVSTVKGMEVLVRKQRAGELNEGVFVDQALLLCSDVAVVSLASAAGQALIPIPVLGALIGSFAGKMACELLKGASAKSVLALQKRLKEAQDSLEKIYAAKLHELEAAFLPSMSMIEYAFDLENNRALLLTSLNLARLQGLPDRNLIKSAGEALAFLRAPKSTALG